MTEQALHDFLIAHPDWSPALILTSEENAAPDRPRPYGLYGPSGSFYTFSQIVKTLAANAAT